MGESVTVCKERAGQTDVATWGYIVSARADTRVSGSSYAIRVTPRAAFALTRGEPAA